MCTLIVIHRRVPGAPLVVAANRDEFFDRPAAGPEIWSTPQREGLLAPRDLRAGGTWLGLNRYGVFAAVTNRPVADGNAPDPDRRSRGDLVPEALQFDSAHEAAESLRGLEREAYNPFNFLVADARHAFVTSYIDEIGEIEALAPGAHVVGNAAPNDRAHAKTRRILDHAERVAAMPADRVLEGLSELCREHIDEAAVLKRGLGRGTPIASTCVHLGAYGTRSSLLLRLSEQAAEHDDEAQQGFGQESTLHYADGAPCEHQYRDLTPLLHELCQSASDADGELPARKAS